MVTGALCAAALIACAGAGLSLGPTQTPTGCNPTEHPYLVTAGVPPQATNYRYVDDTDPTQAADVLALREQGYTVIAGIAPASVGERFAGAINAQEWYPFGGGAPEIAPPPPADAYIIQQGFSFSWPLGGVPTPVQQRELYVQTLSHHPRYLFVDNGNP